VYAVELGFGFGFASLLFFLLLGGRLAALGGGGRWLLLCTRTLEAI